MTNPSQPGYPQSGDASFGIVLPFPVRPSRLDRALLALARATEEQRAAVAAWQDALARLKENMDGLAGSLHGYRSALAGAAVDGATLGAEADRLSHWSDRLP